MNKNILICLLALGLGSLSSCKKSMSDEPAPKAFEGNSVTADVSRPGSILFKWTLPENADYHYVKLTYTNPDTKQLVTRLASKYSDSLRVDGLLNRFGEIDFTFQPFTKGDVGGPISTVKARSEVVPEVVRFTDEKVKLTIASENDIYVSEQEPTEGHKRGLIDGSDVTFYHEKWSGSQAGPFPHYIVYKLPEAVQNFSFDLKNRNNAGRLNPTEMDIYVSDSFDEAAGAAGTAAAFDLAGKNAVKVASLTGLPDGQAASYVSPGIHAPKAARYVWFVIRKVYNNKPHAAIAEITVFKRQRSIFNPETGTSTNE